MEKSNQKTQGELYSELYQLDDKLTDLEFKQGMYDPEEDDEYWHIQEDIDDVNYKINEINDLLKELN